MRKHKTADEMLAILTAPDYSLFDHFEDGAARVAVFLACLVGLERLITQDDLARLVGEVWPGIDVAQGINQLAWATVLQNVSAGGMNGVMLNDGVSARNIRRRLKRTDSRAYNRLHEVLLVWATDLATMSAPSSTERFNHRLAMMIYLLRLGRETEYEELGVRLLISRPNSRTEVNRLAIFRVLADEAD